MPDVSDYFRGYARDIGVNPPVNGADNVQDALAAGGGGSFPDFSGSGSPEGVQTANVGQSYVDTTNGALYWKATGAATNTGWIIEGVSADPPTTPGFAHDPIGGTFVLGTGGVSSGGAALSDLIGLVGTGNGLYWNTTGVDGEQSLELDLGTSADKNWSWAADGSTSFPGPLLIANCPTADPHVAGAVWSNSGVLTLSAG